MLRFFERPDTRWRALERCLHVYALPAPDAPIRDDIAGSMSALGAVPGLWLQPGRYLHATVQRLDAFEDDLPVGAVDGLAEAIGRSVSSHSSFDLEFAPPVPASHAVEAVGESTLEWRSLLAAVRAAVAGAGHAATLTPPPAAPHYSLAYCTATLADDEVADALAAAGRPTGFTVRSVALVSADQMPDEGGMRFRVLRELPLRG